jgi:hypothetical protein
VGVNPDPQSSLFIESKEWYNRGSVRVLRKQAVSWLGSSHTTILLPLRVKIILKDEIPQNIEPIEKVSKHVEYL